MAVEEGWPLPGFERQGQAASTLAEEELFQEKAGPGNLPRLDDIAIDVPVLLFTFAASLLAGVAFGAIPVIRYAGAQTSAVLRAGGRSATASRERHRTRNALVSRSRSVTCSGDGIS